MRPRNDRTSDALVGWGASAMALIFFSSGWMPLAETMCPKTLICGTAKEHLGSLRVMPLSSSLVRSWSS